MLQARPSQSSLHMRFLFVSASICFQLPSDSTSRWTPLPSANSSYCQACSGLSPPSYRPCWAHNQKRSSVILTRSIFPCFSFKFSDCTCNQLDQSGRSIRANNCIFVVKELLIEITNLLTRNNPC